MIPSKSASLKWLIVEDALKNKYGHWVEYISTFHDDLASLGDSVQILCDHQAEQWLIDRLNANPVLPRSIWHRINDGANKWMRLLRIPSHGWATFVALRKWLRSNPDPDIIFVPTALVHHLVGWLLLIRLVLHRSKTRVLLFFPNTPIYVDPATGKGVLAREPTGRLFGWLIRRFSTAVAEGRVILGAETSPMRNALEEATGVPFVYFPHPVPVFLEPDPKDRPLTMAVYGPARAEKGSDILQEAILRHLESYPACEAKFVIQWLEDFNDDKGALIVKHPDLLASLNVEYIGSYFGPGEYPKRLAQTDLLMLPYRKRSYDLRLSRVVLEAMVHGIPVIATRGSTLAIQAEEYGACILCEDGSVESVGEAIQQALADYPSLRTEAAERALSAANHFSVRHFRMLLLEAMRK